MNKLVIALDMDGVLVNTLPYILKLLKDYFGENLTEEDIREWDISKACKTATAEDLLLFFNAKGFFSKPEPMPGSIKAVRALISQGHEVIIVTAVKQGHNDKLDWLTRHLPEISHDDVYFATRKERVLADVFIDDKLEHLQDYKAENPFALVIGMDAAYNRKWNGLRAKNWDEALSWIQSAKQVRNYRKGMRSE